MSRVICVEASHQERESREMPRIRTPQVRRGCPLALASNCDKEKSRAMDWGTYNMTTAYCH